MLNASKGGYREARPQRPPGRGYLVGRSPFHRTDDPDHRHREQWRHDPDAGADQRVHRQEPRHIGEMGDARRERPAPARHHRHRDQGRAVRRADHRHLRGADLGQEELAHSARQSRSRLRHRGSAPQDTRRRVGIGQALRRAVLWREFDGHVSHRPVPEGRPDHAGKADLGFRGRCGEEAHRQIRRRLRHLPARQGGLGREHGVPDRDVQFVRRALVRREMAAAIRQAGMEEDAHDLCRPDEGRGPSRRQLERLQ